ncbi:MAG: hypothetical protein JSW00_08205 [Thermoplasmata archaeon]|nr:MAG: hypothetical protein JSW00_08205 [Thermoplasmata archaeon]
MAGKIDKMKRLRLVGDFLMLGSFLMLIWLFLSAYLSNDYRTTVNINNYGEAHVEMIVLVFFLLPLFMLTVALSFMDWRQTWKAKGKIMSHKYLLIDTPTTYQFLQEKVAVCPRCQFIFDSNLTCSNGLITCPNCGLTGTHSQDEARPSVRIIRNIRR